MTVNKIVKVPVHRSAQRTVEVEHGSTKGATLGVNIFDSAGNVLTTAALAALLGVGGSTSTSSLGDLSVTLWSLIQEIPSTALSVLGVPANSAARPTAIASSSNDTLLRRVSNALDWGVLTPGMFPDSTVTAWDSSEIEIASALFDLTGDLELTGELTIGAFNDDHLELQSSVATYGWLIDTTSAGTIPLRIWKKTLDVYTQIADFNNDTGEFSVYYGLRSWDSGRTDSITISHDGTNAYFIGSNTAEFVFRGTSSGGYRFYDATTTDYLQIKETGTLAQLLANNNPIVLYPEGTANAIHQFYDDRYQMAFGATIILQDSGNVDSTTLAETGSFFTITADNPILFYPEGTGDAIHQFYDDRYQLTGGALLRIFDPTNSDYLTLSHDGTDFYFSATGTTAVQFSGASRVQLTGGTDLWLRDNANLYVFSSDDVDSLRIVQDNVRTTIESTQHLQLTPAASHQVLVYDAGQTAVFGVYEAAGSKAVEIFHDGSYGRIRTTGGGSGVVFNYGGSSLYLDTSAAGGNIYLRTSDGSGSPGYIQYGTGYLNFIQQNTSGYLRIQAYDAGPTLRTILHLTASSTIAYAGGSEKFQWSSTGLSVRYGNQLRIYDAGNTDYVTFSHDGTDFNIAATNTTEVNASGALWYFSGSGTVAIRMANATGLWGYDSGATQRHLISIEADNIIYVGYTGGSVDNPGVQYFSNLSTTASAANAFLDSTNSNRLYRSTSSRRYKRDIRDVTEDEYSNVLQLRPITFRSRAEADDGRRRHFGFIAEEVAAVDRKLVQLDARRRPDSVQYDRITVGLVGLVRDHEARLDALEQLLAA